MRVVFIFSDGDALPLLLSSSRVALRQGPDLRGGRHQRHRRRQVCRLALRHG
jgi:hypothetical protein